MGSSKGTDVYVGKCIRSEILQFVYCVNSIDDVVAILRNCCVRSRDL